MESDFARLDERVLGLSQRVDDLRGEMRAGFQDVRAELRAQRTRVDVLLVATIGGLLGVIATLAVKL